MTSVTFPPRLGGSGVTISDDADPNTGMLNGGHRDRFVPALKGTVDMAQYVYQYAAKIDGAAEDAERAMQARAYVEGYAAALRNNLLAVYRERATLDIDFLRGKYRVDDGDGGVVETLDAGDILSISRASPKWVFGPNGKLREVPPNTIARQWNPETGEALGALIEETRTNLLTWSETDGANWGVSNSAASWANTPTVMRGIVLDRYIRGSVWLVDTSSSSTVATWSVFFYDGGQDTNNATVIRGEFKGVITANTSGTVIFDYDTKTFSLAQGGGSWALKTHDLGRGLYRVILTGRIGDGSTPTALRTAIYGDNKWLGGFQLEEAGTVSSYIPTQDSPVTRAADDIRWLLNDAFSYDRGTVVITIEPLDFSDNRFFLDLQGSGGERVLGAYYNASRRLNTTVTSTITTLPDDSASTVALSYDASTGLLRQSGAGSTVEANWDASQLTNATTLRIGRSNVDQVGSSFGMHLGYIRRVAYLPHVLSTAELTELTA